MLTSSGTRSYFPVPSFAVLHRRFAWTFCLLSTWTRTSSSRPSWRRLTRGSWVTWTSCPSSQITLTFTSPSPLLHSLQLLTSLSEHGSSQVSNFFLQETTFLLNVYKPSSESWFCFYGLKETIGNWKHLEMTTIVRVLQMFNWRYFFSCFSALGFQQFLSQDSDVTLEIVDEGKEHIKREKRRRQRLVESQSRRREFATRFGDVEERGNDF